MRSYVVNDNLKLIAELVAIVIRLNEIGSEMAYRKAVDVLARIEELAAEVSDEIQSD